MEKVKLNLSTIYKGYKITHTWTTHFTKENGQTYDKYDFIYHKIGDEENCGSAIHSTIEAVKEDIDERILEKDMMWV